MRAAHFGAPVAALLLAACAGAPAPATPAPVTALASPAPAAPVAAPAPAPTTPTRDLAAEAARERARRDAEAALAADREALTSTLYFDYDKDELRPETVTALERMSDVLRRHPGVAIRVEGNADDRGSDEYNLALSQRRAAAAKRWLVDHGVPDAKVAITSWGRERPVCTEDAEDCWRRNRRDEVRVTQGDGAIGATAR